MSSNDSMQLRSQCDGSCVPLTSTPIDRSSRGGSVTRRVRHSEHHHHHHHGHSNHAESGLQLSESDAIPCLDQITSPITLDNYNGWTPGNRIESTATKARFAEQTVLTTERRSVSMTSRETYVNSEQLLRSTGLSHTTTTSAAAESEAFQDECSSARTNHLHLSSLNRNTSSLNSKLSRRGRTTNDTSIMATNEFDSGLDSESEDEEFSTTSTMVATKVNLYEQRDSRRDWLTGLKTLIVRVLFISTKPVWIRLYKLFAFACIVDVWLLSRVGHFVRHFVHSHLKTLLFALLLLLLSGLYYSVVSTTLDDGALVQTVSELSSGLSATLFNSCHAAAAAFVALFNFSSSTSSYQKPSLNQVDLSDEDLRFRLRAILREELAVVLQKEKQTQAQNEFSKTSNMKETAEKDKLQDEALWKEIVSLNSRMASFEGEMNSFRHTANATLNLSEHSQWLRQWLITTLIELWAASEGDDDNEVMKIVVQRLKRSFTSREDFLNLVSQLLELREEMRSKDGSSASTVHVEEDLLRIIKREIALYDADRLGLADFALESSGGSVINTRCSETYTKHSSQLFLFGIPLWHVTSTPRTVIQPGRQPGECWPFVGSEGYIVIMLSRPIRPTAFSLEHIPKSISPTASIDAAPKDFSVWGLKSEMDHGIELGKYQYDQDGSPVQTFQVQESEAGVYGLIELRIHSNHGNSEFTCVYRFRVHGIPQEL